MDILTDQPQSVSVSCQVVNILVVAEQSGLQLVAILYQHLQVAGIVVVFQEFHQRQAVAILLVEQIGNGFFTGIAVQLQEIFTHRHLAGLPVHLVHYGNRDAFHQLVNHINGRLVTQLFQIHSHKLQNGVGIDLGRILDQAAAEFHDLVSQLLVVTDHAHCVQVLQSSNILSQLVGCVQHLLLGSHILVADGQLQRIGDLYAKGVTGIGFLHLICTNILIAIFCQRQVLVTCDGRLAVSQGEALGDPDRAVFGIGIDLGGHSTGLLVHGDQIIRISGHLIVISLISIQCAGGDDRSLLIAQPIYILLDEYAKRYVGIVLVFCGKHVHRCAGQYHNHCQQCRHGSLEHLPMLFHYE